MSPRKRAAGSGTETLRQRLAAAEATLQAVIGGQVDAVWGPGAPGPLLLKSAQDAMRASEARLSAILDALPAHIALLDESGTILATNESWRLFGVENSPPTAPLFGVGANYLAVSDGAAGDCAEEAAAAAQGIREVLAGARQRFELEYPCHSPTKQRWFRMMATRPDLGEAQGAVVMHVDITYRKLAESVLTESESRYRLLFESNPHPMWVYDRASLQFLDVNNTAVEHYGYGREQFLRMTLLDLHPPTVHRRLRESIASVRGAVRALGVWPQLRADGSLVHAEITAHDVDFAGRDARLVLAMDVTARLLVEERSTAIFRASPLCILVVVPESGDILEANESASAFFGIPVDELRGRSSLELGLWADLDQRKQALGRLLAGQAVRNEEVAFRKRSGEVRHALASLELLTLTDQRAGALLMFTDITERRNLQEQLQQSQKLEAIGRLAGGVAHDFNNVLGVIIGYGGMLARDLGANDPRQGRLAQILKAADRAASLTRQLLAFSRKQVLQPRQVDLNVVVQEIEPMLRRLIGEDIHFVAVLGHALPHVRLDPTQIDQVIMNLAVNSRDAMPAGGRLILETAIVELDAGYCALHPDVTPGTHVMLALSDTGHGMDAGTRDRIFEPFFTTKPVGQGTGLGLATVHGIVKQSGGHIWLESAPGKGTTFKIYFRAENQPPHPEQSSSSSTESPTPSGGGETILLAEDDPALREMNLEVLESYGYDVIVATRGDQAFERALAHGGDIDLLLTDVVMPGLSGRELATRLAAVRPGLRVLFMSGYTTDALLHHGIIDGTVAWLEKPFTPERLARSVRDILDGPQRAADSG